MNTTNWRELIQNEMAENADRWENVIQCTLSENQLDERFESGFGGTNGIPFTTWTHLRVYFPVQYDGAEWVASVARNPDGKPTPHVGG